MAKSERHVFGISGEINLRMFSNRDQKIKHSSALQNEVFSSRKQCHGDGGLTAADGDSYDDDDDVDGLSSTCHLSWSLFWQRSSSSSVIS